MGGKSSKQKSKKNKTEEDACGEAEGRKVEQAQEPLKEGDAPAEKKPEENGTVKKESDKIEEGNKSEENTEIAQTLIVSETVSLTSEKSPLTEGAQLPTEAPSDKSQLTTAEDMNVQSSKEIDVEQNVENKEETEQNVENKQETEQSVQSAQKQPVISETATEVTNEVPAEPAITTEVPAEPAITTEVPAEPAISTEVPSEPAITTEVPVEPAVEEKVDVPDESVVEEKTEEPVEPIPAPEEPVQPEESSTIEPSTTPEELVVEALPAQDLPPPPPTPAETEELESASAQQDQHAVATGEGDVTAAAPSDTAESGAATNEVTDTTEAETAAPSETSRSSEALGFNKIKKPSKLAKTLTTARTLFVSSKKSEPSPATVVTEFKWEGLAETVLVSGSFNKWQENIPLVRNGEFFTKTLDLPIGEYLYKFLVDDQWMVNKTMPIKCDENGEENNVLIVELIS